MNVAGETIERKMQLVINNLDKKDISEVRTKGDL